MITHLEPYILEWEVKWVWRSITTNKASGTNGISGELFKILKYDAIKELYLMCQQIWKTQDWKKLVFLLIPKKNNVNKCSKYHTMFKLLYNCTHFTFYQGNAQILQAKLQQHMNQELPDIQAGFRKGRGTRDQISSICWIIEKDREFQKTSNLLHWLC